MLIQSILEMTPLATPRIPLEECVGGSVREIQMTLTWLGGEKVDGAALPEELLVEVVSVP